MSASSAPVEANLEEALALCGAVEDRAARLECFDSLASAARRTSPEASANSDRIAAPEAEGAKSDSPKPDPHRAADKTPKEEKDAGPGKARFVIIPKDDLIAREPRPSEFEAEIVEAWLEFDKIYVRLDNGEVWKQTSRDRPRIPKAGQTATFTRGLVGWLASFGDSSRKHSFSLVE